MNAQLEKAFIRNKAAQVFALTFVMEYLTLWPKFFFDILNLVGLNPHGVDIYLRMLMAIDAEVVDRDIVHTPEVSMCERVGGSGSGPHSDLAPCSVGNPQEYVDQRLHEGAVHPQPSGILVPDPDGVPADAPGAHLSVSGGGGRLRVLDRPQPHRQRPVSERTNQLTCSRKFWMVLWVIGSSCSRFVNLLLSQMSMEDLREEACDCLFEIVNKGMDPVDKTKLVESLCQVLQSAGFFNIEQVGIVLTAPTQNLLVEDRNLLTLRV